MLQEALLGKRKPVVLSCPARQTVGQHSGKQNDDDVTQRNGSPVAQFFVVTFLEHQHNETLSSSTRDVPHAKTCVIDCG